MKGKTLRGGVARLVAQAANFALRLATLMILARLLDPEDFGLVGMVTAVTGVLSLFRDFGLSAAVVQRSTVTQEQISTLFWLNQVLGVVLALVSLLLAPIVSNIYGEQRLLGITAVLGIAFILNAVGLQHGSLLQREMRFGALAVINTVALAVAGCVAIVAALAGMGYWSLVLMTMVLPLMVSVGCWIASGWVPERPRLSEGIGPMLQFGGTLTLNTVAMYVATNLDKVLVGRYFGVDALGIYGRAYQLVSIPIDNLNSAAGEVAYAALSRIQHDRDLRKRYFLKGYSLLLAITVPITVACWMLAGDLVTVVLGHKWVGATPIFRLLAPTILAFAIVNPTGWFIYSLGMGGRALAMSLVQAPLMILSYIVGLSYGIEGVASAYSIAMLLWVVPAISWAVRGTAMTLADVLLAAWRPIVAGMVAASVTAVLRLAVVDFAPLVRLVIEGAVLSGTYVGILVFGMGQRELYLDVLRHVRK